MEGAGKQSLAENEASLRKMIGRNSGAGRGGAKIEIFAKFNQQGKFTGRVNIKERQSN